MDNTRRDFLKSLGGGILVVLAFDEDAFAQSRRNAAEAMPQEIGAWLHVGQDGSVKVFTGKAELGQNIRTSLSQAVAEELRAPLNSIQIVLGDTGLTPYDAGTFGSRTTPYMAPQLRKAAAATREILIGLAAEKWGVDRTALTAADGCVRRSDNGQSLGYGELTKGQQLVHKIPADPALTPAAQWQIAGKTFPKVNGRDFVMGKHRFVSDLKHAGMLHGKVLRAPSWGASLFSVDTRAAEALPGVKVVRDGEFVGVTAPTAELAEDALDKLRPEWKLLTGQPATSGIFEYLKAHAESGRSQGGASRAAVDAALASSPVKLRKSYTVAYIAHTPLEPRVAVAEWNGGKLTVWTGTQRPFGVRAELMAAFKLPESQVRVIVPDSGAGYGGKHTGDAALEAARLSKSVGQPVKLFWTREEEFNWAYFRPAGLIEINSAAGKDGVITAWEVHNYNSGTAGLQTPYSIEHQIHEYHAVRSPLRQGSYRALASTANHFARESHMDELAHATALDPLDFRLKNARDARLRGVLEAAAERFGWSTRKKSAAGHGFGIAAGFEKGGYVATCVELFVSRPDGAVKVRRIVEAFECGAVVNPDHVKNQIEGAILMGLGGALFEAVEFENGRMLNASLSRYRVPRFSDTPPIEVVLVDRKDLPSAGAGETPICGIAPAFGNAIFDAVGTRLRSMPLASKGIKLA